MARHIVRTFGCMAIEFRIARYETTHKRLQIGQNVRIGILLDQQRSRGVAHKACQESVIQSGIRQKPNGPIALLDEHTPVVVVATESPVLEKVISNIQEVRARGARVIAVASEGNDQIARHATHPTPAK